MAKKKKTDKSIGLVRQFDDLKKKHPDAMLLFRTGDFYEIYQQDAVKAAAILATAITDRIIPGEKEPMKMTSFPYAKLDTYLPKLIRAGARVAICDRMEDQKLTKMARHGVEGQNTIKDKEDMAKKKTEQAVQEKPAAAVKDTATNKPAKEEKTGTAVEAKEEKAKEKRERKPREPQMVTANGEKVTHGHAYQSKQNPEQWYFTAKMDGRQLKPQRMDAADLAAYQKKEMTVPQLMERYYPTKLLPKVPEEAFKMPKPIAGAEGSVTMEKFNVYKEKDEQRPDYGKYKFYAQVGNAKMSAVASREDLNAYFDRVITPEKLVERNFGERLHLKSAYEKYKLPEGVDMKGVRVAKDHADNKWKVSVDMGDKGRTSKKEISFDDGYSLFKAKTATRDQIAAKYLNTEITGLLAAKTAKVDKSASMKM